MKKKYIYLIIIFLIVVSCTAFGRIAGNDFIDFDDNAYITDNNHIKSGVDTKSILWAFTTTYSSNWHPLTWLSHILDWSLFGENASGHHLVSLLLHIGAVIFLFLFFNKTTNNIWPAAFAAALFALHPLRVESVAWVAERKDVLSMFFGMASIYAYAFYAENYKRSRYFMCFGLFAMSLMSKPLLVTLPFVLLLLDYWPLGRWTKDISPNRNNSTGRLIGEKIPFIVLTIASSIVTFWAQNNAGAVSSVEVLPFSVRIANAMISYVAYLGKTFWPVNLSVFYPYASSIPLWKAIISCMILIAMTAAVSCYIRKLPFLFVGWFWYLGTLVPMIGLVQVGMQAMADRYTYLPSIGIAIMLAWGAKLLFKCEDMRKKILFPAGIAALAILAVFTWQQCGYWRNGIEIWNHALHITKNNALAHKARGANYDKLGQHQLAINDYNEAIRLKPDYADAYYNRGVAYAALGQHQLAINDYHEAIRLKPDYAIAHYNRGVAYDRLGRHQLAINDYHEAIRLKPDNAIAYYNRGVAYDNLRQEQRAIQDYREAIRLKPDYADAYNNRGIDYLYQGNNKLGCSDAHKACALGNCKLLEMAKGKGDCR
ncbi:MAG: tetratricopeptide repeat protein [Pseudomonadota bacterium]